MMSEKPTFAYVLRLVKPESLWCMSPHDEAIIDEHFEYLKKALAERRPVLAGRCVDGEFGIAIFTAESEKQAEEFMKNDPVVKKGVMTAESYPFRISLIN
jgi:uncharacterized protein YciI